MSALVIPLGAVRAAIAAARVDADQEAHVLAAFVVDTSVTWAERAFKVASGPAQDDAELRRDIYRAAHRRLRAALRRRLGKAFPAEARVTILDQAEAIFSARVEALAEARDKGRPEPMPVVDDAYRIKGRTIVVERPAPRPGDRPA